MISFPQFEVRRFILFVLFCSVFETGFHWPLIFCLSTLRSSHETLCCKKCYILPMVSQESDLLIPLQAKPSTSKEVFPTLEEIIFKFKTPGQGMVVHLSNPIMRRSFCPRERRLKLELNVYGKSPDTGSEGSLIP